MFKLNVSDRRGHPLEMYKIRSDNLRRALRLSATVINGWNSASPKMRMAPSVNAQDTSAAIMLIDSTKPNGV